MEIDWKSVKRKVRLAGPFPKWINQPGISPYPGRRPDIWSKQKVSPRDQSTDKLGPGSWREGPSEKRKVKWMSTYWMVRPLAPMSCSA